MDIKKIIIGSTLLLLLGNGTAVAADLVKGIGAFKSGKYKTALAELRPLAEQGDDMAQYILGAMYRLGKGVPMNEKIGVMWFTKAAEQGRADAQYYVGTSAFWGRGMPLNYKIAQKWFTKAAKQGHGDAQDFVGHGYEYGQGVLKDFVRAYMWYNLSVYNDGGAGPEENLRLIAQKMTRADVSRAQDMSSRCFSSGYTDC
jgi:TPR repeat protein